MKIEIEPELLWGLYWGDKLTIDEIATNFNCGYNTILRRMKEYNIPGRGNEYRFIRIDPELLWSLYWGWELSMKKIAKTFRCTETTILQRMKEHDIPRRKVGFHSKYITIEPELLWGLYYGQNMSMGRISNTLGCGRETVRSRMKEYDIPIRESHGQIFDDIHNINFSDEQYQIFEGLMLGDGHLSLPIGRKYPYYEHTEKNREFLVWIANKLGISDISKIHPANGDKFQLISRVIPPLKEEYYRWYPNGSGTNKNRHNKIIPHDLKLTRLSLLHWYIGDGTLNKRDNHIQLTNKLSLDDARFLIEQIEYVLDVDKGVTYNKQTNDYSYSKDTSTKYTIRISKKNTLRFFDAIRDLDTPRCYDYKFQGA